MTTTFKPGDRVRLTGSRWNYGPDGPQTGDIETIDRVYASGQSQFRHPSTGWRHYVDPPGDGRGFEAEMVNEIQGENGEHIRSGYQEYADGTLTPVGIAKRDRHVEHIAEQDRIIRRRNEQIAEQLKVIEAQKAQLAEYAAEIEALNDSAYRSGAFPFKPLRDLQKRIGEANAKQGFHERGDAIRDASRNVTSDLDKAWNDAELRDYATTRLALITTEVAEAIEEIRHGRAVDETYYLYDDGESEAPRLDPQGKPRKSEGVPSELADVVIRAFDFAHEFDIDLAAMIDEKISFNATREFRHGKQF